jgi:hypothetical protein
MTSIRGEIAYRNCLIERPAIARIFKSGSARLRSIDTTVFSRFRRAPYENKIGERIFS